MTGEKTGVIIATVRTERVMMMVITCHSFSGAFQRLPGVCLPHRRYFHTIFLLVASSRLCAPYALLPLHLYRSVLLSGTHFTFLFQDSQLFPTNATVKYAKIPQQP